MDRRAARTLACLMLAPLVLAGCHSVNSSGVPWYRGIPASFLSRNSLEAEIWRQQRTGVVEGWPTPPRPVVREPIPLAGETLSPTDNETNPPNPDSPRSPTEAKRPPAATLPPPVE